MDFIELQRRGQPLIPAVGAGRYAPSPSGNLHIGNLRTALVAWLFARNSGRNFLFRIDDLDRARDQGYGAQQLLDLLEIGLDFNGQIVFQSHRDVAYEAAISHLASKNLVYECYCSRKDILAAPTAPHAPPGSYPGTCRDLSNAEREKRAKTIAPREPALRLRSDNTEFEITDALFGKSTYLVDDFVLRRGDGVYAYNLATVIDDADSGVDQVVRGADLLVSAPRQAYLAQLLSLSVPQYAHVPLVVNGKGQRLAKRDGAVTLAELSVQGVSASDILTMLASSLGLAAEREKVTVEMLLTRFDPEQLPLTDWVFKVPAA